jgi:hypothetical protein
LLSRRILRWRRRKGKRVQDRRRFKSGRYTHQNPNKKFLLCGLPRVFLLFTAAKSASSEKGAACREQKPVRWDRVVVRHGEATTPSR